MSENGESTFGKLIFWAIVIVVGFIVLRVAFAVLRGVFALTLALLPILLVAWILYKLWQWLAAKETQAPGE